MFWNAKLSRPFMISIAVHVLVVLLMVCQFHWSRHTPVSAPAMQAQLVHETPPAQAVVNKHQVKPTIIKHKVMKKIVHAKPQPKVMKKIVHVKPQPKPKPKPQPKALPVAHKAIFKEPVVKPEPIIRPTPSKPKVIQQQLDKDLLAHALSDEVESEQAQWSQLQAQRMASELEEAKLKVLQAISQVWLVPEGVNEEMSCELGIRLGPQGVVLGVDLIRSSGNDLLDRSAKTAVLKASPLPVPAESELFDKFREFRLTVRPEGIISR